MRAQGIHRIQETFSNEEFEKLLQQKGDLTWREFILQLTKSREETCKLIEELGVKNE